MSPRIGLVLGAGGLTGFAFHSGVLRALREATGWDPRTATIIVGSSAGAQAGALLRGGVAPAALPSSAGSVGERAHEPIPLPRPVPFPASWPLAIGGLRHPLRQRPAITLAGLLPRGTVSLAEFGRGISQRVGGDWPTERLWLTGVSLNTGDRVVLGREVRNVDVGSAVAASCAIPGWFEPVEVNGDLLVDGGVHSPTNADLLADPKLELDLVVVASPMSVTTAMPSSPLALAANVVGGRTLFARLLDRELEQVRATGIPTVAFQPTPRLSGAMGPYPMSAARARNVAHVAHDEVIRYLGDDRLDPQVHAILREGEPVTA